MYLETIVPFNRKLLTQLMEEEDHQLFQLLRRQNQHLLRVTSIELSHDDMASRLQIPRTQVASAGRIQLLGTHQSPALAYYKAGGSLDKHTMYERDFTFTEYPAETEITVKLLEGLLNLVNLSGVDVFERNGMKSRS